MVAALGAFTCSTGEKSGHLDNPSIAGHVPIKAQHLSQGKVRIASQAPWRVRLVSRWQWLAAQLAPTGRSGPIIAGQSVSPLVQAPARDQQLHRVVCRLSI